MSAAEILRISDEDISVAERCEAECRKRMAELAGTKLTWKTRQHMEDLAIEVDVLLQQYNLLTLGR